MGVGSDGPASPPDFYQMQIFSNWMEVKDGHPAGRLLYNRHYSCYHYKDGRQPKLFAGPGRKIVLLSPLWDALFVWREFRSLDNQAGICCAIFRNEGPLLSSELILEAEGFAKRLWPGATRFYTYIDTKAVKSPNPGYCFKKAGWFQAGYTKKRKLLILEKLL